MTTSCFLPSLSVKSCLERTHRYGCVLCNALFLFLAVSGLRAQVATVDATVVGAITDPQGAVIPGVTVTITSLGTNIPQQTISDDEGRYRVAKLPPGEYRLLAEQSGFKSFSIARLTLEVNQTARVDIRLEIGQVSERMEVTSELALLKTDTSELGAVVYEQLIKELPLNGRNYLGLANLTAGAATVPSFYGDTWGSQAGSYNGMSTNQNQYQLDGSDNTSIDIAVPVVRPSLDAIREFKVQTTQYSAEFGRTAGAVVSAVTKSGSNQLHGAAWEFIRNDVFDARNFFAASKPPYRQNQFGATLGGPIVRDRVFFFLNYEGYRIRQGVNRTASVPTALERQGDFSQSTRFGLGQIYDPFNLDSTGQRVAFPGGRIPASRINPGAANALTFYPLPNIAGTFPNLLLFPSLRDDDDKFMVRFDARVTDKDSIFGRYALESEELFSPSAIPLMGTRNTPNDGYNVSAAWTRILSPRMVTELRGSVSHRVAVDQQEHHGTNYNKQFGYDNADRLPTELYGFPGIGISGYTGLGGGLFFREPTTNVHLVETLSLTRGKHSFKFGFSYNWTDQPFEYFANGGISHT